MANYGKIFTPLGILFLILGILLGTMGAPPEMFGSVLGVGGFIFIIGFSRLVQGKERKIMGQMLRPKAAARGSAVWVLVFVNIMPLIFQYETYEASIFSYLGTVPPFPLATMIETEFSATILGSLNLVWLPFAYIAFHVIWLFGFLFSGKIPKIYYIFNIFFITLSFTFWMNFAVLFLIWTLSSDKTGIEYMTPWVDTSTFIELIIPLSIGLAIMIFALIMIMRYLNKLQSGFANFSAKCARRIVSFIFLILTHLLVMGPLIYGILNCLEPRVFIAPYVNYIPIVFIAIVIFKALTSVVKSSQDFSKKQSALKTEKSPTAFGFSTAIFLVILFIAWAPIILPLVDNGQNTKDNSIHNENWNGWSTFRENLETIYGEENIFSIQSSISTLAQMDPTKQVILVIPGPNKVYNPAAEIPYFLSAFDGNFSMFICDDHGTAGTLLLEMFFASLGISGGDFTNTTPITIFPSGILRDNESYYKNPAYPVITNFNNVEGLTSGIDEVVLGHATAFLGGDILASLGWNYLGYTSGLYSFVDVDNDGVYNDEKDIYPLSAGLGDIIAAQEASPLALAGSLLTQGLPLGGYPQAVFSYKEIAINGVTRNGNGTYSSRVFCATDASWLNNDLINLGYDNLDLALNAMDWLACGRSVEDTYIVFDEAHLMPTTGRTEVNSAASFGTTQGYVNWLSTNPILGLVYPIFALQTLRKWIPKEGNKRKLQLHDLEEAERRRAILKFRTSSFFAQKINWYREHHKYKKALLELFRRIQRKVNRLVGDTGARTIEGIMQAIQRERGGYISKNDYKRIQTFFEFMADLKRNKANIKDEREFEDWFLEMQWIGNKI